MQGHHLYNPHMKNVFVVLRDGRDVMVSYYYYCLFAIPHNNEPLVERERKNLRFKDYDDIRENLPRFIEFKFTSPQKSLHTTARFTYTDFVNNWADRDAAFVKYENLLADPVEEMSRAVRTVLEIEPDRERLKKIVEKIYVRQHEQTEAGPGEQAQLFQKRSRRRLEKPFLQGVPGSFRPVRRRYPDPARIRKGQKLGER